MITNPDADFYERVTSRIFKVTLVIAGAGALTLPGTLTGAGTTWSLSNVANAIGTLGAITATGFTLNNGQPLAAADRPPP